MSTLYITATPIGNLEDISLRALRILSEVDLILCEDTRVTDKLLSHYQIKTPTSSYHQHSDRRKEDAIVEMLKNGKNIALVSDAGTPGISDPGGKLIQYVIEKLGDGINIEAIPGASAITAALSISGIPTDKFIFMGFPPHKKGRQTFVRKMILSDYPVVIYESKHRVLKLLSEIERETDKINKEIQQQNSNQFKEASNKSISLSSVVVCREISKMHETTYRGNLMEIREKIESSHNDQKGEFVIIVGK